MKKTYKLWPNIVPISGKSDFEGERRQFLAKTFFFGLHLILAKKHFNFLRRPFFWSSPNFGAKTLQFLAKIFFGLH